VPIGADEDFVRAVLGGDSDAFAPLVAKYRRAALVSAMAVLGNTDDAEEVAQEAFVRAYTSLATCRDHARFSSWLMTIVRHTALNYARSARRRRTVALDDTAEPAAPEAGAAGHRVGRAALLSAIRTLPAAQREVLLLADLQGLSHADISARTGLSVLMSRRHLSDARRRVRDLLRNAYDT
jgi:RNA polymerase sigma-70 factor (ECF subfamily)